MASQPQHRSHTSPEGARLSRAGRANYRYQPRALSKAIDNVLDEVNQLYFERRRVLADLASRPDAKPTDFVRPGHEFVPFARAHQTVMNEAEVAVIEDSSGVNVLGSVAANSILADFDDSGVSVDFTDRFVLPLPEGHRFQ